MTVSCLPKNEVVDTGDKYTFTTIPNTAVNTPSALYEAGDTHSQAMEWMRNYGKFNAGNLRTQDVLRVSFNHCRLFDSMNKHILPRAEGEFQPLSPS